jgi:hypothetical protein
MSLSNYFTSNYLTDTHYEAAYNNNSTKAALQKLRYGERLTRGTSYSNNVLPTPSVYIFGREVPLE